MEGQFPIRGSLEGHSNLLTGGTGFVGSLILEQLLRCVPGIDTVYVLIRDGKGQPAAMRLRRLLHSGLFNLVRDQPSLLAKVCLVQGDLEDLPEDWPAQRSTDFSVHDANGSEAPQPWDTEGLYSRQTTVTGLLQKQQTARKPLIVIHTAARIALIDPLKVILKANYQGTKHLLAFARALGAVGFVHVSTAYVNRVRQFLPCGTINEQHYPLKFGNTEVHPEQLVSSVLALPDGAAEARRRYFCDLWDTPHTYVLSKNLAESMLVKAHSSELPISIVRPVLIGALAGKPYPGFVGNVAGYSAGALCWFRGFFGARVTQLHPFRQLDMVPAEYVSSVTVAAAAGLVLRYDTATGVPVPRNPNNPNNPDNKSPESGPQCDGTEHPKAEGPRVAIYHVASTCVNPLSNVEAATIAEAYCKTRSDMPFKMGRNLNPGSCGPPMVSALSKWWLAFKVGVTAAFLRCFGQGKMADQLQYGHAFFKEEIESGSNDHQLFFNVDHVLALERLLSPEERDMFPLVWRGDWKRYGFTYMAGLVYRFLRMPVPPSPDHDFKHIPNVHVPAQAAKSAQP